MKIHKFNRVSLLVLALLMSACGNVAQSPYGAHSISAVSFPSGSSNSGSLTAPTQGKFTCPSLDTNNITPQYWDASTINGYFRLCTDPSSQQDVLVNGSFGTSNQICVFPASSTQTGTSQQYVYWLPDPNTGLPSYSCGASSSAGTTFTFQNATFNAVYIVDGSAANQMQACLNFGPGTPQCPTWPNFSYGAFR